MSASEPRDEMTLLLAGQVLGDLDGPEQVELRLMLDSADADPNLIKERNELARAAATLDLMLESDPEPSLPEELHQRVLRQADRFVGKPQSPVTSDHAAGNLTTAQDDPVTSPADAWNGRERLAWLACAASLLLCVSMMGWSLLGTQRTVSLQDQRTALLSSATDVLQVEWAAGTTPLPASVSGDVVWSNDRQSGFMRFVGLPVNDPSVEQYQLWIIDPDRDDEPIDGGVFDIQAGDESIVAIDAKLQVLNPAAFAITIEKPGGVVVSTQERLPLLASVR